MSTISIPDVLHERFVMIANQREESLETLVQHALEQYMADWGVRRGRRETADRVAFMTLLDLARTEHEASGEPWLDWEGIEREVADRRGGYQREET
jgi:hypothetical protein